MPSELIETQDWSDLRRAVRLLENPGLAARLTSLVGAPVEEGLRMLPRVWHARLAFATESIVARSLDMAVSTLDLDQPGRTGPVSNRSLGVLTGAVGGYFGLPGTVLELPITTTLMLRSIAAVAADEGEDLRQATARLACIEVFALGGRVRSDDAAETGYYSVKLALAYQFSAVSEQIVRHGIGAQTLPAAVSLIRAVAARFGVAISDKAALQMVPVVGALGGAVLNAVFIDHFQDMARGHFIVRRLERRYGIEAIRSAYEQIASRYSGNAGVGGSGHTIGDAD